jgi:hypothetical protein
MEIDLVGFNLYRSTTADGSGRTRIFNTPAKYPGTLMGGSYQFNDTNVQPNITYYYWLEVLARGGPSEFIDPASTRLNVYFNLYLPITRK